MPSDKHPTIDDLIELPTPGDPQISPDGAWVAYTLRKPDWKENEYITQIWLVPTSGGEPRQLTFAKRTSSHPRWSPDGRWLAFLSQRPEDEHPQIYRMSSYGGEAERLSDAETGILSFSWSPDGKSIAYTAIDVESQAEKDRNEKFGDYQVEDQDFQRTHLWILDLESKKLRKLTTGEDFHVTGFRWAPGSDSLAFTARPTPDERDWDRSQIYTVDPVTLEIRTLTGEGCDSPVWSPDGTQIAFNQAGSPTYTTVSHIWIVSATGGQAREVSTGFDESPWLEDWGPAGIYFLAIQRTALHLFCLDPTSGQARQITPNRPEGWLTFEARFSQDFSRAAMILSDATRYAEVIVLNLNDGEFHALTDLDSKTMEWNLGRYEIFHWTSPDGIPLEGVLTFPPNFVPGERHPLLVVIHGGPSGISRLQKLSSYERYAYPIQLWAAKGALVLQPNYRGSAGYGQKFLSLNVRNLGVGDALDVVSGVDALVEKGWVDPSRVGAMGWSQGGYISAFLTTSSDRFRAVSVGAGISNWVTYYVNTDLHPFTRQYLEALPWDDPEIYRITSPMTYIKQAKTPTLIQHGEFDRRVPIPNAFELYQGLQDVGVETKLVIYRGMGHGISRPRPNRQVMQENLDWFNHWIWGETFAEKEPAPCYVALAGEETGSGAQETPVGDSAMRILDVQHWARRDQAEFYLFSAPSGLVHPGSEPPPGEHFPQPAEVLELAEKTALQITTYKYQKLVVFTRETRKSPASQVALGCLQVAAGIAGGIKIEHREMTDPGW